MSGPSTNRFSHSLDAELTDAQKKVHGITSDTADAATSDQMRAISEMTQSCGEITKYLLERLLTRFDSWRSILKCLQLVEYLIRTGSEQFVNYFRACPDVLEIFTAYDEDNVNTSAVRTKATNVCHLLAGGVIRSYTAERSTELTLAQGSTSVDRSAGQHTSDEAYYRASLTVPDISSELAPLPLHPEKSSGFADVYLCDWIDMPQRGQVGVKIIRAAAMQITPSLSRTILREIEVWHRAKHPHIHPLLGLYWGRGQLPSMVSPWCRNGDIPQYLKSLRRAPNLDGVKLRLMQEVVSGLQYCALQMRDLHRHVLNETIVHHSQPQVVHGDIKGANVLVSDSGAACLCDFGLATVKADHSASPSETLKGTVRWMSPELFDGSSKGYTTQSDIWAVGCLILEIQSERAPYYDREAAPAVVVALGKRETPSRPIGVPDRLWWLMHECWAPDPQERPTIDRVAERLQDVSEAFSLEPQRWHEPSVPAASHEFPLQVAGRLLGKYVDPTSPLPCHLDDLLLQAAFVLFTSDIGTGLSAGTTISACVLSTLATCVQRAVERDHDALIVPVTRAAIAYIKSSQIIDKRALKEQLKTSQRPAREIRRLATPVAVASAVDAEWIMAWLSCRVVRHIEHARGDPFTCIAFIQQHKALMTGSSGGTVCVFDFVLGSLLLGPLDAGSAVSCLADSVTAQRIACGTMSGSIRIWRLDTGQQILGDLVSHSRPVTYICFSGDGERIASRSEKDGAICIWDATSGTLLVGPFHRDADNRPLYNLPPPVAFSEKGDTLLIPIYPGNMQSVFDYRAGPPTSAEAGITPAEKRAHAGSPGQWLGKARVLWTSGVRRKGAMVGTIRHVRDVRAEPHIPWSVLEFHSASYTPPGMNPYPLPLAQPRSRPGEIVLSPSGQLLAVVDEHDQRISVWDAKTMARVTTPLGTFGSCMVFSANNMYVAAIGAHPEGGVTIWDLTDQWRQV